MGIKYKGWVYPRFGVPLLWTLGVLCIANAKVRTQTLEGKGQKEAVPKETAIFIYILLKSPVVGWAWGTQLEFHHSCGKGKQNSEFGASLCYTTKSNMRAT